jgi:membrane protease YdiL (CAAX protease family)
VDGEYQPHPTVPAPAHPPAGWTGGPPPPFDFDAAPAVPEHESPAGPPAELRLKVELAVMLFATAGPGLVFGLRGLTDPERIDTDVSVIELAATLVAALGPAAIATYLLWRDRRLSAAGFDRRPLRWVAGYGALGGVCAVLALWSAAIVLAFLYAAAGNDPLEADPTDARYTVGSIVAGLLLAIVAGVGEEIVYRAYAISRLEELGWARTAIYAPWAVFTVQHLYQGPEAILIIGAVGGTFVWLYRWQRSVWPVIVAHALYDAFVLVLLATLG